MSGARLSAPKICLANGKLCRLLPKGLDWHFHAFCAASEPVTVSNLPSLLFLPHSFVLGMLITRSLQPAALTNALLRPEQTLIKLLGL